MSSLSKTGLFRKSGTVLVGVALLGSLMLTACAPAAKTNDSAPNPTAAATTEAAKAVTAFKSEAFDMDKQTSIDAKKEDPNTILLGNGVITQGKDGDKLTVSFSPYDSADEAWKYTSEVRFEDNSNNYVNLLRWKDKSYLVVTGTSQTSTEASGLTASTKTSVQHVTVLDAATGKVVKDLPGTPNAGASTPNSFLLNTKVAFKKGGYSDAVTPFLTGLFYQTYNGPSAYKLVDPLSGNTVATSDSTPLHNEAGFYKDRDFWKAVGGEYEQTNIDGLFGNFTLFSTKQEEVQSKTGSYIKNSKYSLVNTANKAVLSEISCANSQLDLPTVYSPNFRYVVFSGNFVFDTQTGASFCTTPTNNLEVRPFVVSAVDDNGNMYGAATSDGGADGEYLKINLSDTAKVETLATYKFGNELPIAITDKGSAVFRSELSQDVLVVVPAKG